MAPSGYGASQGFQGVKASGGGEFLMCPDGRSKTDLRNSRRRFFFKFSNFLEKFLSVAAGTEKLLIAGFFPLKSIYLGRVRKKPALDCAGGLG